MQNSDRELWDKRKQQQNNGAADYKGDHLFHQAGDADARNARAHIEVDADGRRHQTDGQVHGDEHARLHQIHIQGLQKWGVPRA